MIFAESFPVDPAWVLTALMGAGGVIGTLFWLFKGQMDKQIEDLKKSNEELKTLNKTLYSVAEEGAKSALTMANYIRAKEGKPPVPILAPVVPEGNSPPSNVQRRDALLQTMRANLAAVKLAVGLEARGEPGLLHDGTHGESEVHSVEVHEAPVVVSDSPKVELTVDGVPQEKMKVFVAEAISGNPAEKKVIIEGPIKPKE